MPLNGNREPFRPKRMPLTDLPVGASGRVYALAGEAGVCSRLREMGFCESAVIARIGGEQTLLCDVCGTRIALSSRAANYIVVELIRGAA